MSLLYSIVPMRRRKKRVKVNVYVINSLQGNSSWNNALNSAKVTLMGFSMPKLDTFEDQKEGGVFHTYFPPSHTMRSGRSFWFGARGGPEITLQQIEEIHTVMRSFGVREIPYQKTDNARFFDFHYSPTKVKMSCENNTLKLFLYKDTSHIDRTSAITPIEVLNYMEDKNLKLIRRSPLKFSAKPTVNRKILRGCIAVEITAPFIADKSDIEMFKYYLGRHFSDIREASMRRQAIPNYPFMGNFNDEDIVYLMFIKCKVWAETFGELMGQGLPEQIKYHKRFFKAVYNLLVQKDLVPKIPDFEYDHVHDKMQKGNYVKYHPKQIDRYVVKMEDGEWVRVQNEDDLDKANNDWRVITKYSASYHLSSQGEKVLREAMSNSSYKNLYGKLCALKKHLKKAFSKKSASGEYKLGPASGMTRGLRYGEEDLEAILAEFDPNEIGEKTEPKSYGHFTQQEWGEISDIFYQPRMASDEHLADFYKESDVDGNYMSVQNIKEIQDMANFLAQKVHNGENMEDWVEDKISSARQMLSDLTRYYSNGEKKMKGLDQWKFAKKQESADGGAEGYFADIPYLRETREFAQSGENTNDPKIDPKAQKNTPPTPSEIEQDEDVKTLSRVKVEEESVKQDKKANSAIQRMIDDMIANKQYRMGFKMRDPKGKERFMKDVEPFIKKGLVRIEEEGDTLLMYLGKNSRKKLKFASVKQDKKANEHLADFYKESVGAWYNGLNRNQKKLLDNYMRQSDPVYYNFDDLPRGLKGKLYDLDDLADEFRYHSGHYQLEESVEIYLRETHPAHNKGRFANDTRPYSSRSARLLAEWKCLGEE